MYRFRIYDPDFLPHSGCDVEFSLHQGECLVIAGENGIGKSTLLRRLYLDNRSLSSLVEQKGMDFFFDRSLHKIKKIFLGSHEDISRDIFLKLWSTFKLDQKEDRYQSSLSGGESQALKLCLGLSVKRELYLLDEPSQFLDEASRMKLNDILEELLKNNKTLLLVEHDLSWVKFQARVMRLNIIEESLRKETEWSI